MRVTLIRLGCTLLALLATPGAVWSQGKAILVNSRPDQITVDFYPVPHTLTNVDIGGRAYVAFQDAGLSSPNGLPVETFIVGIPQAGTPSVEVLTSTSEHQSQVSLASPVSWSVSTGKEQRMEQTYSPVTTSSVSGPGNSAQPVARISRISTFRSQRIAVVEVQPYRYDPSTNTLTSHPSIRIRISFPSAAPGGRVADPLFESTYRTILVNYEQAKQWRVTGPALLAFSPSNRAGVQSGPNYQWFNPAQQYYAMKVAGDGVYSLTYSNLQNLGLVPENIDPRSIEIFYKGVSLSVRSVGEADGQFNQNDTLEFFGSKLYDTPGVLNEFSDTSVYWLTFQGQNGLRSRVDSSRVAAPTADYFNATIHRESNTFYYYGDQGLPNNNQTAKLPGEGWYWSTIRAGNSTTYQISLDNLYTTGTPNFQVQIKVHSSVYNQGTPNHILQVAVNGTLVGTDSLAGYQDKVMSFSGPVTLLKSGSNAVKLTSVATAATLSDVLVDWVDLRYSHTYRATSDTLMFVPDRVAPNTIATFTVAGYTTNNILACRLDSLGGIEKTFDGIRTLSGTTWSIKFVDTVLSQRRYFVIGGARRHASPVFVPKTFQNLSSTSLGADYLIVTAPAFLNDANRLATYRSQQGIGRTKVVLFGDIADEYGFGFFDPVAIRRFLLAADSLWVLPKPSYVLFFGDANWDYKNFLGGNRPNYVPSYGNPVSDEYFGSSPNDQFLQTKFIGRIPCSSQAEASAAVDRIVNYESQPIDPWNKRYMFISGGFDASETQRFGQFSDALINQYVAPSPLAGVPSRLYRTITQVITSQEAEQQSAVINTGAVWINYYGHGGTDTWGNGIDSPDQLTNNEGRRHVISDISCSTARFAEPTIDSFGEGMLMGEAGGAIAYFGSAGFGFEAPLQSISQSIYKQISVDSVREMGRLMLGAKVVLWSTGTGSVITQEALQQYTLLGDPALKLAVPLLPDYAVASDQISSHPSIPTETDTSIVVTSVLANYGLQGKDSVEVRIDHEFQNVTETLFDRRLGPIPSFDTLSITSPSFSKGGVHKITVKVDPDNSVAEVSRTNNTGEFPLFVNSSSILPILPLSSSTLHPDSVTIVVQNPGNPAMQSWMFTAQIDTSPGFASPSLVQLQNIPQGTLSTSAKVAAGVLNDSGSYYWRGRFQSSADSTNWVGGYFVTSRSSRHEWLQDRKSLFLRNAYDQLSVGDTVRLDSHTSPVLVTSAGFSDGNSVLITVAGASLSGGFANRGYNVAVLNQFSGAMESFGAFSIYSDAGDTTLSLPLINFLNNIPAGRRVVMGIWDEGAKGKSQGLNQAIEACGSGLIRNLTFRGSWAMVGWKGAPKGSVPEAVKPSGGGPVTVRDTLLFQAETGSITSPAIGPAVRWKGFGMNVDTTVPGTHVSADVIRRKTDGSIDTLFNVQPGPMPSSQFSPAATASIQVRATLKSDSAGLTPRLTRWWIDYDPPPELAINYRSISLSSDSLLQGTPVTVHIQVSNIGAGPADSVLLKTTFLNLSSGRADADSLIIPSIAPNSVASVDQVFQTLNHVGANSLLVQLNPSSSIPEMYQANNLFAVPLTVHSDTIRPSFAVTFDGQTIYNGDYISSNPTILAQLASNSALPITDQTNVILLLDDRRVSLGGSLDSLFEPATASQNAVVTLRPQLESGEHALSLQVNSVAGNAADTSAFRVSFKVQTKPGLLDVYNYPNPFARETQFTFNLVGSNLPDELRIRIYSLAGRLIQELALPGSSLRMGFNRVAWDGRDREGDEVANGVYFYKVAMSVGGKSEEVIQKLAKVR